MKKIINNKKYDTDTARVVGSYSFGNPRDFQSWSEALYCKRTGEYFLYGEGGPQSRYAQQTEQNWWSGGERIMPLSYEYARAWAEEHLTADEYESEFGAVTEDESAEAITISLPAATVAKLRRQAQERGSSVSAIVADILSGAI